MTRRDGLAFDQEALRHPSHRKQFDGSAMDSKGAGLLRAGSTALEKRDLQPGEPQLARCPQAYRAGTDNDYIYHIALHL
ncbi:hypothetical protein GCM10011491_08230 [Brucella endophytica]|uniref:Uncharacterized protein n=1 Tax=Brucella endophytica TaxID=1963359 RepID=A0A916WBG8_9HYPH|nr:hypothetical protein GCM10011491_08230 [Brucella endophytica]